VFTIIINIYIRGTTTTTKSQMKGKERKGRDQSHQKVKKEMRVGEEKEEREYDNWESMKEKWGGD
jgi:hypothetical protein